MPYPIVPALAQLWDTFEDKIKNTIITHKHLSNIKKLMTAVSVIDLSLHEIYKHAEYVHEFTELLIDNNKIAHSDIKECYQLWHDILKLRNQIPLQIKHHQALNAECDFRFSLQLIEGNKPCGFKEVQVLNSQNEKELEDAIAAIHRLDCIAEGTSFAKLPLINDGILSSLMEYKDVICLISKNQSDDIIGYCWGVLLKNIEVDSHKKVNVFWIMDLARDPDFFDREAKIGDKMRQKMFSLLKSKDDCDFVGYQHLLNHKFHMSIIDGEVNNAEIIKFNGEEFWGKTSIEYNDTLAGHFKVHLIRTKNNALPYPKYDSVHSELFKFFWYAAHSTKDFLVGGVTFFGRTLIHQLSNNMLDNLEERLTVDISEKQTICDKSILTDIILSDLWEQQGNELFCGKHIPDTMQKLQTIAKNNFDLSSLQNCVKYSGMNIGRNSLTSFFYNSISIADSFTFILNRLLKYKDTPKEWIELITDQRKLVLNETYNNNTIS